MPLHQALGTRIRQSIRIILPSKLGPHRLVVQLVAYFAHADRSFPADADHRQSGATLVKDRAPLGPRTSAKLVVRPRKTSSGRCSSVGENHGCAAFG